MKIYKFNESAEPSLNKREYEIYVRRSGYNKIDLFTSSENFENLIPSIVSIEGHIKENNYYSDIYIVENTKRQLSEDEISLLRNVNKYNL
jgi:hypothetical protein